MRRTWSLSSMLEGRDGTRSPPWQCQLLYHERVDDSLVLDMVALEQCPSADLGCPRSTPFSLHISRGHHGSSWDRMLAEWAAKADLVTIICGVTDAGMAWLCLTSVAQHLLLEL
jgi:hypothetical protein